MQEKQAFHKIISSIGNKDKRAKKNKKPLFSSGILFVSQNLKSLPEKQTKNEPEEIKPKSISDELQGFKKIIQKMIKNIVSNTNNTVSQNKTSIKNMNSIQNVFNTNKTTTSNLKNNNSSTENFSSTSKNVLVTTSKSNVAKVLNETTENKSDIKFIQNGDLSNILNQSVTKNTSSNSSVSNKKYVRPIQAKAKGGWISGPLKGYPVSLDGRQIDFIGHGTEFVARKESGSFVIPVDTPETRKDPSLTERRVKEAKRAGFVSPESKLMNSPSQPVKNSSGLKVTSLPKMKAIKVSAKDLPKIQTLEKKAVGGFLSGLGDGIGGILSANPLSSIAETAGNLMQSSPFGSLAKQAGGLIESSPLGNIAGKLGGVMEKATGINPVEEVKSALNLTDSDESSGSKLEKQMIENREVKTETEKIREEQSSKQQMVPVPIPANSGQGAPMTKSGGASPVMVGGQTNFDRVAREEMMFPTWRRNMG